MKNRKIYDAIAKAIHDSSENDGTIKKEQFIKSLMWQIYQEDNSFDEGGYSVIFHKKCLLPKELRKIQRETRKRKKVSE